MNSKNTLIIFIVLSLLCSCSVDSENIIIIEHQPEKTDYTIQLVQTKKLNPPKLSDKEFSIYTSKYYGKFEIWLIKKEEKVDSIDLNDFFDQKHIGFVGSFPIKEQDITGDGQGDYNIGIEGDSPYFEYILFTISDTDTISILHTDDGILKHAGRHHSECFEVPSEGMITVTHYDSLKGHYYDKTYQWDESMFISE